MQRTLAQDDKRWSFYLRKQKSLAAKEWKVKAPDRSLEQVTDSTARIPHHLNFY
jgi:hypothetical protein